MRPTCAILAMAVWAATSSACGRIPDADAFPGLAIEADCRGGGANVHFAEADDLDPVEHARGDPAFLSNMGELPLPCVNRRAESYRFVDPGGAFGTTRVIGVSRAGALTSAWFVSEAAAPGSRAERAERQLTSSEWQGIGNLLSNVKFWSLPARILVPAPPLYLDGCGCWILEGYKDRRYHRIDRYWDDRTLRVLAEGFHKLLAQ